MSAREEVADPYSENRRWNTAARWFLAMALGFSALGYLTGFLAFGALGVHAEYALVAGCSLLSLVGLAVIAVFLFAPHRLLPSCAEKPATLDKPEPEPEPEPIPPSLESLEYSSDDLARALAKAHLAEARTTVERFGQLVDDELAHFDFTDQERVVASCILHGGTYKAIGRQLYLSENTIKFHAKNICGKAGVSGRRNFEELVKHSMECRLDSSDEPK